MKQTTKPELTDEPSKETLEGSKSSYMNRRKFLRRLGQVSFWGSATVINGRSLVNYFSNQKEPELLGEYHGALSELRYNQRYQQRSRESMEEVGESDLMWMEKAEKKESLEAEIAKLEGGSLRLKEELDYLESVPSIKKYLDSKKREEFSSKIALWSCIPFIYGAISVIKNRSLINDEPEQQNE